MDASTSADAVAEIAGHLFAAKLFSLASCVMLFYDIFITFGDEVEKIWKQPFTCATVLWFINRYLSPVGFIVVIVSFHDPRWTGEVCDRYVLYPEILKLFTAATIGLIFILRLYSIYGGSMFVLGSISALLIAQIGVKIWAFTDGTSLKLPEGLVGCILTGKNVMDRFVYTWVAELVFDTAVFIATLSRTLTIYRRNRTGAAVPLIKVMMRDGAVYFVVIFVANLITVILFLLLPADLKAVNASFSTLITSLMVSRLILNLRTAALRPRYVVCINSSNSACLDDLRPSFTKGDETQHEGITAPVTSLAKGNVSTGSMRVVEDAGAGTGTCRGRKGVFSSAVIGNLGEPVAGWGSGDYDVETIHDRERSRKQSLHGRDGREMNEEADMQEVPLEIDSDGIMLRERAPTVSDKRKPSHHVHRITSHNRERSHSRTHQRDRTRGGASISTTSTSPNTTSRLRGIIVEVTRDIRVEPALGSARSDVTGFTTGRPNTRGTIDQFSDDDEYALDGPSLSTSPLSNAPSLLSLHNIEAAIEEEERYERAQTLLRSKSSTKARSGLAGIGMGAPSGSSGGRAGRAAGDPGWIPPDTWMLEEGVQMEELGKAK